MHMNLSVHFGSYDLIRLFSLGGLVRTSMILNLHGLSCVDPLGMGVFGRDAQ